MGGRDSPYARRMAPQAEPARQPSPRPATRPERYFDVPGKSGKQQRRQLRDRREATLVRRLLKVPGPC